MCTSKPYLQTGFSMAHLAVLLDLPEHHLAYYFREERKQSFTDYRNNWRVEHAKKLIEEGKAQELTLEATLTGCADLDPAILSSSPSKKWKVSPPVHTLPACRFKEHVYTFNGMEHPYLYLK